MMSLMKKELKDAEEELCIQGKVDECIEMYQNLYKYDEAIRVAEASRHPDTSEMRQVKGFYFRGRYAADTYCVYLLLLPILLYI